MKKIMPYIVCLIIILLLSACDNEPEAETPVYNPPVEPTVKNDVPSEEPRTDIHTSEPEISNSNPEILANEILNPDFKGVTKTTESPTPVKSIFSDAAMPILSYDAETDTLYYVKYSDRWDRSKDNYIYAYKDGKSELVIDMPANYINYYDGSLYFTSNDDILALYGLSTLNPEGRLYKYDMSAKTLDCLVDEDIHNVVMYEDYIYYTTAYKYDNGLIEGSGANYRVPVRGGAPETINAIFENIYYLPYFYGEYQLRTSKIDYSGEVPYGYLELVSEQNVIKLTNNMPISGELEFNFRIDGDKLWFYYYKNDKYCIASIDLSNGETRVYDTGRQIKNGGASYAVIDNDIYVYIYGQEEAFIKHDNGLNEFIDVNANLDSQRFVLTDGKHLYGFCLKANGVNNFTSRFFRLNPLENGGLASEGIY